MQLHQSTVLMMLTYLGVEAEEGEDLDSTLDESLAEYNLDRDQFLTRETCFSLGYHRGLAGRPFSDEQAPQGDDGPDKELMELIEDGYAYGLEARDLRLSPPPSLVLTAHDANELEAGMLAKWAEELDLSEGQRLAHAINIGSGKSAVTVPAGTPVDVLGEAEKDGVPHTIVLFDGSALLVPNPEDASNIVSADTAVAPEKKTRKGKKKSGGAKRERGPTLKQGIIKVIEGGDGGPGPLQTNGQFASRVKAVCREMGIGDKAGKFVQQADRHVPYYLNCYRPTKQGEPGRLGVEQPLAWVVAATVARKYYLRADGSHEERMKAIPADLMSQMEDREARVETTAPAPAEPKKKSKDDPKDKSKE